MKQCLIQSNKPNHRQFKTGPSPQEIQQCDFSAYYLPSHVFLHAIFNNIVVNPLFLYKVVEKLPLVSWQIAFYPYFFVARDLPLVGILKLFARNSSTLPYPTQIGLPIRWRKRPFVLLNIGHIVPPIYPRSLFYRHRGKSKPTVQPISIDELTTGKTRFFFCNASRNKPFIIFEMLTPHTLPIYPGRLNSRLHPNSLRR